MALEEAEFQTKSQKVWSALYKKCHGFVYQYLYEVISFQLENFLELKYFVDPIHEKLLSD